MISHFCYSIRPPFLSNLLIALPYMTILYPNRVLLLLAPHRVLKALIHIDIKTYKHTHTHTLTHPHHCLSVCGGLCYCHHLSVALLRGQALQRKYVTSYVIILVLTHHPGRIICSKRGDLIVSNFSSNQI